MIEKLYNWMMQQAASKNAVRVLIFVSFIESSFFPLPPDPVLAIVVAKNRHKAMYYAAICAIASVLGGFLGYYIGYAFFELIGSKILVFYGQMDKFESVVTTLNEWAFWIICAKGLTPIPYKIVTNTYRPKEERAAACDLIIKALKGEKIKIEEQEEI